MSLERDDSRESFAPKLLGTLPRNRPSCAQDTSPTSTFLTNLLETETPTYPEAQAFELDATLDPNQFRGESTIKRSPWAKCMETLVGDFLERKNEILSLNPGRRTQIESHINKLAKVENPKPLDSILRARADTAEFRGLLAFARETAVLQLLQFFLLKRWIDLSFAEPEILRDSALKLNWQIQALLKSTQWAKTLGKVPWAFLKINMYSWFKASPATWELLLRSTEKHCFAEEPDDFLVEVTSEYFDSSATNADGHPPLAAKLAWELLLQQKCADESLENMEALPIGKGPSSTVCIMGSSYGQATTALSYLHKQAALDGVFAFARGNFELFVAEIHLLWALSEQPVAVNPVMPMERFAEVGTARISPAPLTASNDCKIPAETAHALCFPDNLLPGAEIKDAVQVLLRLRENGSLLLVSDNFWITERSESAQEIRSACLAHSSIRLIVDFRHLTVNCGATLPKCFFILERNTSKEVRDGNRPKIIKVRGHVPEMESMEELWQLVLDCIPIKDNPGEVKIFQTGAANSRVRVEVMSAATTQAHLGASPWSSLSEPAFYQITSKLKLYPHKLHQEGYLLRPQKSASLPVKKGIHFMELPGIALFAEANAGEIALGKDSPFPDSSKCLQHFFLPEMTTVECPSFFAAMINSSPIQFWYRLEWEQYAFGSSRRGPRPADSILKLMPLSRLLPPASLVPAEKLRGSVLPELERSEERARELCLLDEHSLPQAIELHKLVIDLESTIDCHLAVTREYAKHLFPQFKIARWDVPEELPEISAAEALVTLQHLQHAPLRQHPSIQCSYLKNISDFKVTDLRLHVGQAGLGEIILLCGQENMMRVQGPTLLMQAAAVHIQRRIQRPWSEISQKIAFPIDTILMLKQLEEFVRLTRAELAFASRATKISDFIFCNLFGLNCDSPMSGDAMMIRSHLNPHTTALPFGNRQKNIFHPAFLPAAKPATIAEAPTAPR